MTSSMNYCVSNALLMPSLFWTNPKRSLYRQEPQLTVLYIQCSGNGTSGNYGIDPFRGGWYRQGFRLYWRWKSRVGKPGRPRITREIRDLIRRISWENPTWGAPRILSELLVLGHEVAEATVAKYIVRQSKPPSQTWRTLLANHVLDIAACDFFTVPTVTFRILYVFILLRHARRHVVHFNVTTNPYAEWTAQQIVNAFPYETASHVLIRDRDGIYGDYFKKRIKNMGIEEVLVAPRSPWQNPYCEQVIGSIRRECLDHMIVLNERHLYRVLTDYFDYDHNSRPHLSLDRNSPTPRDPNHPLAWLVCRSRSAREGETA